MVTYIKWRNDNSVVYGPFDNIAMARQYFEDYGLNRQVYYVYDEDWRQREATRHGLIDLTEFGLEPIKDHFLHISSKNEDVPDALMVSFTLNEEKGLIDRQESGRRIGRYLKEFYPQLSDEEITRLGGEISGKYNKIDVQFARTREEIRSVYERSRQTCSSCMTYNMREYSSYNRAEDVMPVEAYEGPDLAIAYTLDVQGRVSARTICWPEKRLFGRIYAGDTDRFRAKLESLGYRKGSMDGARMDPILLSTQKSGGVTYKRFAMPYIDGDDQEVTFDGEHFIIGRHSDLGEVKGTGTSGYVEISSLCCVISGEEIDAYNAERILGPDGYEVYVDRRLRGSELWENQTAVFRNRTYWMGGHREHYVIAGDGVRVPHSELGYSYVRCGHDSKYYPRDQIVQGYNIQNLVKHYVRCELTGDLLRREHAHWMPHGAWWSSTSVQKYGRRDENGQIYSTLHSVETAEAA